MTKVFLFGCSGKMGRNIIQCAKNFDIQIVGGFDIVNNADIPTFNSVADVNVPFDAIVDFSRPETLESIITLARKTARPVVLASTGYSDIQEQQIDSLSKEVAVFRSGNMSVGINLMQALIQQAVKILGDGFDIEIIEKHHNQKVDSPSGTAKMLFDSASDALGGARAVCGRVGNDTLRQHGDIGIHAVRGGTVVGEHDISFYGDDEIITISHTALSRKIFANGALRAAKFIADKKNGVYSMKDIITNS